MAKTNWQAGDTVQPADMNDIGQEINQLRTDIDNIDVPPASLTQAGIVMLSNSTNGTRENVAATEKAVAAAFQYGIERKNEVVAALNSIGVSASTSEDWDSLINKMAGVIKATGNATPADVLSGKTFSNIGGNNLTGAMPNRGAGGTVTPGTTNQTKLEGYYSSVITILGDAGLVPGNIPKDISLFGVQGILERMTTPEKQDIANAITGKGIAASVNDSNSVLAQKIGQIVTGKQFTTGSKVGDGTNWVKVTGLPFKPDAFAYYSPNLLVYGIVFNGNIVGASNNMFNYRSTSGGSITLLPYTIGDNWFDFRPFVNDFDTSQGTWNWVAFKW